jgi:hypothetical protein
MKQNETPEVFNSGIVDVYPQDNRRLGQRKLRLRFQQQSVGVRRYYQAQTSIAGNRIDRLIKVPATGQAERMDIAVIASASPRRQYRILRIQEKPERGVELWELQSVQVAIGEEG